MIDESELIDYYDYSIDNNRYLAIIIYHKKSKSLLKCYKIFDEALRNFLEDNLYEDVSTHLFFTVGKDKNNNQKLKLDFRL